MSTYTVKEVEKVKDMPDAKFGPAKVLRFTFEEIEEQPEWFTKATTPMPGAGTKLEGEIEQSNFGPKWKPAGSQQRGGFQKSPAQEERIVRQHSQEMAVRTMAILGRVLDEESFRNLVSWFQDDAYGKMKSGVNSWPMNTEVPFDDTDMEIKQEDAEMFQ